ncbi:TetR/AcrR family transcriptional regulator [Paenibacillus sp. NPDC057886]|uniref:TetR/AcrR family transcriptional regulator n=1 Tax=Paenibacillus sp. NPDC057886 TaxID=3346270 RepID=UPI0036B3981C
MIDNQREETRRAMIYRLIHQARKESLTNMRAEDMAKCMDVSKVTMYKYFSSKDDILASVISNFKDYLRNEDIFSFHEDDSVIVRYQKTFEQSLMINFYFPEHFFDDFKNNQPFLYEEIVDAQHFRFTQLEELYRMGLENGIFHPVNAAIFVLDDQVILRRILDPSFLIRHNLLLQNALMDYYNMQKRKLLKEEYLHSLDDSPVKESIGFFVTKNSRYL